MTYELKNIFGEACEEIGGGVLYGDSGVVYCNVTGMHVHGGKERTLNIQLRPPIRQHVILKDKPSIDVFSIDGGSVVFMEDVDTVKVNKDVWGQKQMLLTFEDSKSRLFLKEDGTFRLEG